MDNRRWYKRISTCFWFLMATFPLWFSVLSSIFGSLIDLSNNTYFNSISDEDVFRIGFVRFRETIQQLFGSDFMEYIVPSFLFDLFNDLFSIIGLETSEFSCTIFVYCLAWFVWVYFIELMVDFIVWLPRWFHSILEKGMDKLS